MRNEFKLSRQIYKYQVNKMVTLFISMCILVLLYSILDI